ncbi:beta-glucosidase [Ruminococcaceae bacterium YRB3002]|nr:beta-glucosidase [Ruminococcaceae bacterium YRB3002]
MPEYILDWNKYTKAAMDVATEGAVLLENRDNVLPLADGARVALFGRMQTHYYKSGTGSGGMVNVEHVVDIREGLKDSGRVVLDEELMGIYDKWDEENPVDPGIGWGNERWSQEEMPVTEELVKSVSMRNDTAVIVIARTAGEDRDNSYSKGSLSLQDGEEELIRLVTEAFAKTVVLLNTGNIIDMSFVKKYRPQAVMYIWQCGMIGGTAAAKLLTGEENPSGLLTDTIARTFDDYPSTPYFGDQDSVRDQYTEDIFVGYRYFTTFNRAAVMYPFGYGLSYTTFDISGAQFVMKDGKVIVAARVTNLGEVPGKKTVLLFADPPAGALAKPSRVLVGFTKTYEIMPGGTCPIEIEADMKSFASFDDDGRAGCGTGWILEKGIYDLHIGGDSLNSDIVLSFTLDETRNIEAVEPVMAPVEEFERFTVGDDGKLAFEKVPTRTKDYYSERFSLVPPEIPQTGDKGIKLIDVKNGKASMDDFIAQISDEDLCLIIRGEGMSCPKVTTGTAGGFAGVDPVLNAMGVPACCCSDGPSGMRIDSGKKAFSIPNGTCIASTFNLKAVESLFGWFGIEMISNRVDTILGPGMNIHRHPLNGRNFEYFSEDPLLSGKMASAQIKALEQNGVTATIKHFCVNNRETRRRDMDSVVSERALREIYLRGFEIAVREGGARSIMTSYNKINGTYAASHYELNTLLLREQWGYKGITMTDWWAYIVGTPPANMHHELRDHAAMARAQNDLYMVCSSVDPAHLADSDCYDELMAGNITRAELQRNARNILNFAMNTPAMDRLNGDKAVVNGIDCPFHDESVDVDANYFYDIEANPVINVLEQVDTSTGKDMIIGISCETNGVYEMEFTASSELNELAQIPMTLYFTSIPFVVLTWNGTEGRDDTRTAKVIVNSRHVVLRAHLGGPGVRLKTLKFKFVSAVTQEIMDEILRKGEQ